MPYADFLAEANQWIDEGLQAAGPECVTSSFQAECVVLVHMLVTRRPKIPVLFLDTGSFSSNIRLSRPHRGRLES